jgi:hypothetical protein
MAMIPRLALFREQPAATAFQIQDLDIILMWQEMMVMVQFMKILSFMAR